MDVVRTRIDTYPLHLCKQLKQLHPDINEILLIYKGPQIHRIEFMMEGMDYTMCVDDFKNNYTHIYEHMKQIEKIVHEYELSLG